MKSKYVVSKKQRRTNTRPSPRAAPKHRLPELVPSLPLQTIAVIFDIHVESGKFLRFRIY